MTIVFPFHAGDVSLLKKLLEWVKKLGGCKKHKALMVADAGVDWAAATDIQDLAASEFKEVELIANDKPVSGWPQGPNSLFATAASYIKGNSKDPWFWCETDCIPLKPAWADMLQATYQICGKEYMGAIVPCNKPGLPAKHLNGNAVYPWNAADLMLQFCNGNRAFDIASAEAIVPLAEDSFRVQHFWGLRDLPPTFGLKRTKTSPEHLFTLERLREGAVVFHRSKDGSLIRCLWKTAYPKSILQDAFILVLPFCKKDASLMLKNVHWMKMLQPGGYDHDVMLAYDSKMDQARISAIETVCREIFKSVLMYRYPHPNTETWPQAPNFAFQSTANYIYWNVKRPWFWMEADMVPIKPGWLEMIQDEYNACGKPYMGSIVQSMGHMNGSGIYPDSFAVDCPKAMKTVTAAWDYVMKEEMIGQCFDASHIMQHWWGMNNGKPHHQLGNAPSFVGGANMKWINPNAVTLHRCKDGSLIDILKKERGL